MAFYQKIYSPTYSRFNNFCVGSNYWTGGKIDEELPVASGLSTSALSSLFLSLRMVRRIRGGDLGRIFDQGGDAEAPGPI